MKVRNAWLFFLAFLAIWIMIAAVEIRCAKAQVIIRPRLHMALTDPGHNGAILLEMWCDQLTVGHDDQATYCWHNGVAVIKVPHSAPFSWAPLEAK